MTDVESKAHTVAKEIAEFLKTNFGATRVMLFGSLAQGFFRDKTSDIDIYFEGVPKNRAFSAIGHCLERFHDSEIDLKPGELCEAAFRDRILKEGILL